MAVEFRTAIKLLVDLALMNLATVMACLLRPDECLRSFDTHFLVHQAALLSLFRLIGLYSMGVYRSVWRHASLEHLCFVAIGVTLGSSAFYGLFLAGLVDYSLHFLVIDWLACLVLMAGSRITFRILWRYRFIRHRSPKRVLVVGAGEAGALVAAEIKQRRNGRLTIGFVDDEVEKVGRKIGGLPIIGKTEDIPRLIERHKIDEIVVTCPPDTPERLKEIVCLSREATVSVRVFPAVDAILSGEARLQHPENVRPQDLLDREQVDVDTSLIGPWFDGKRILISGAGGSIGSELCRQLAKFRPSRLYLMDHDENGIFEVEQELKSWGIACEPVVADVKDLVKLKQVFAARKPDVVFHAAAHKHVPMMEIYPEEAVKTNIIGTRNIAACAVEFACERFVFISTDKAVKPSSVMGASKRAAEIIAQSMKDNGVTDFVTVRFGNVLDSRGSLLPNLRRQITQGGPITITHPDMERYFMTIPEAVLLVLLSAANGRNGDVMILDMGRPINILDLAERLIRLSGKAPVRDIGIQFVGVRPGEKLNEELLSPAEQATAKLSGHVFITPAETVDFDLFTERLERLEQALPKLDADEVRGHLQSLVPGYVPAAWRLTTVHATQARVDPTPDIDSLPMAA